MKAKSNSKAERRLTLQLILAVSMAIFGCLLIVAAFVVPPTGEIHPTVLTAFGELLTALATILAHRILPLWAKLKRSMLLRFQINNIF